MYLFSTTKIILQYLYVTVIYIILLTELLSILINLNEAFHADCIPSGGQRAYVYASAM